MPFDNTRDWRSLSSNPERGPQRLVAEAIAAVLVRGTGTGFLLYFFASENGIANRQLSLACLIVMMVWCWVFDSTPNQGLWSGVMQAVSWYLVAMAVANLALVMFGLPFGLKGLSKLD